MLCISPLRAATFLVNNSGDATTASSCDGTVACSLRQALTAANGTAADDRILFNIPGSGTHTIAPTSALPAITQGSLVIDGYSQPGASVNTATGTSSNAVLRIALVGSNIPTAGLTSGFRINTTGSVTIRGLSIDGFRGTTTNAGHGILLQGGNLTVTGCWIGVLPNGAGIGNQSDGLHLLAGGNKTVGGATPSLRNVIARNRSGIQLGGNPASVRNNLIGILPSGSNGGNNAQGILVGGDAHVIHQNVIGNNAQWGLLLIDASDQVVLTANRIGTDSNATLDLGNLAGGIGIEGGESGSFDHTIGTAAEPNIIAFNEAFGIAVNNSGQSQPERHTLAFNRIFANTLFIPGAERAPMGSASGLGIDLAANGVTPNDPVDSDNGPNGLQNFPILSSATRDTLTGQITVSGSLRSRLGNYRLVFYANEGADPSNHGEGQYLGEETLDVTISDVDTNTVAFSDLRLTFPGAPSTISHISATATRLEGADMTSTSEFSPVRSLVNVGPNVFTVNKTADTNDGACNSDCSLREAITAANATANNNGVADQIRFAIPGTTVHRIVLASQLPNLTGTVVIDGYSQAGSVVNSAPRPSNNAQLKIVLDYGNFGAGLTLQAGAAQSVVKGLSVVGTGSIALSALNATGAKLEGNWIGIEPNGTITRASSTAVLIGTTAMVGGASVAQSNLIHGVAGINIQGAGTARGNSIGVLPDGSATAVAYQDGVLISFSASQVLENRIAGAARGVQLLAGFTAQQSLVQDNDLSGNLTGVLVAGGSGHRISGNVLDSCTTLGMRVASTVRETMIAGNRIGTGCGMGVDLDPAGINPNDALDVDVGANDLQNHPVLFNAARSDDQVVVQGVLSSLPNTTFVIRFCALSAPASAGHGACDLGELSETMQVQTNAVGEATFARSLSVPVVLGATHLTASAARLLAGGGEETGEFGPNRAIVVNTAPAFLSAGTLSRAAGSQGPNLELLGTLVDSESPINSLSVLQVAGGNATGVTLDHFSPNAANNTLNGLVTTACNATSGVVRLEVSDGELSSQGDILFQITANTPPVLGYGSVTLPQAGFGNAQPTVGPGDNGPSPSLALLAQGAFTGTVNLLPSGQLNLVNAGPVGTHAITVRATDSCGSTTDATATVIVQGDSLFRNGFE
jgi:CSLREA domain-containing protein